MSNNNSKFSDILVSKTKIYLVIIAILLVIICVIKPVCIIPAILIYIAIFVYALWTYNKRKAELSEPESSMAKCRRGFGESFLH